MSLIPFDIWNIIFSYLKIHNIKLIGGVSKELKTHSNKFTIKIPDKLILFIKIYEEIDNLCELKEHWTIMDSDIDDKTREGYICYDGFITSKVHDHIDKHPNVRHISTFGFLRYTENNFRYHHGIYYGSINLSFIVSIPFNWMVFNPLNGIGLVDIVVKNSKVYVMTDVDLVGLE